MAFPLVPFFFQKVEQCFERLVRAHLIVVHSSQLFHIPCYTNPLQLCITISLQVGLAVGDVDRLQKVATENRIALQVTSAGVIFTSQKFDDC